MARDAWVDVVDPVEAKRASPLVACHHATNACARQDEIEVLRSRLKDPFRFVRLSARGAIAFETYWVEWCV